MMGCGYPGEEARDHPGGVVGRSKEVCVGVMSEGPAQKCHRLVLVSKGTQHTVGRQYHPHGAKRP
jgi:hypothetical protein